MINKRIFKPLFVIFFAVCVIANAGTTVQYVKSALNMCYNNVIPSLYLFMVLSNYISAPQFRAFLSVPLRWYARLMKADDRSYPAFILLSLAGGFAVGAGMINRLRDCGYNENALKVLSVSLIGNSFAFCAFAVGIGCFGNFSVGVMMFSALSISNLVTAFILSFIPSYDTSGVKIQNSGEGMTLVESVGEAVKSVLTICGFVIFFYCVCEVISLYISSEGLKTAVFAFTEVTCGSIKAAQYTGNPSIVCLCLSLLPVCTLAQVGYFTKSGEICRFLVFSRVLHIPLSVLLFNIFANLFPVAASVGAYTTVAVGGHRSSIEISATLFVLSVIFICIFDSNKLFTKHQG